MNTMCLYRREITHNIPKQIQITLARMWSAIKGTDLLFFIWSLSFAYISRTTRRKNYSFNLHLNSSFWMIFYSLYKRRTDKCKTLCCKPRSYTYTVLLKSKLPPSHKTHLISLKTFLVWNETDLIWIETCLISNKMCTVHVNQ